MIHAIKLETYKDDGTLIATQELWRTDIAKENAHDQQTENEVDDLLEK